MRRLAPGAGLLVMLLTGGCDWVQDRFRECRHIDVDLKNMPLGNAPLNMIMEGEELSTDNLVGGGASRRVSICAERGDRKRFYAARGGEFLGVVNCVLSRDPHEYIATVARVVWDADHFVCENF